MVSPACASDAKGQIWIGEFLDLVKEEGEGEMPDFLGVHYYGAIGEEAVKFLEGLHERFPGLRVVVSEIACTSRVYEDVVKFTAQLCNCKYSYDGLSFEEMV